jgi:hypothetical protein
MFGAMGIKRLGALLLVEQGEALFLLLNVGC